MRTLAILTVSLGLVVAQRISAQTQVLSDQVSVSAKPVLDAAGPRQRAAIKAVYLIACLKDNNAGTGFLLSNGLLVTNQHVVGNCDAGELLVVASSDKRVQITRRIVDKDRDLALLKPSERLDGGLELAKKGDPVPGTTVSTWGYPFLYNGFYPLLSVGYVAGYRNVQTSNQIVKHIVVNGAFNHGNSGGPLLVAQDNKVVGIVVATYHFFPEYVAQLIDAMQKQKSGFYNGAFITDASGRRISLSDAQVVGITLKEFYDKSQVMIGEAIAASELAHFISEKQKELGLPIEAAKP